MIFVSNTFVRSQQYLQEMNKSAILLMNLGSPDSPTSAALKPYLNEFLMDERVIDIPYWVRSFLVKGIIVPFRAPKSAEKYKTVWTDEGSPLVVHTKKLTKLVSQRFDEPVYYSMRYGNPTTESVLKQINSENPGLEKLILFPLYPHYAMSSFETAVVQVQELHKAAGYKFSLETVPPFYNEPHYINALANTMRPYLANDVDHYLFSFHGIPERHVKKTDPQRNHCLKVNECCSVSSEAHNYCYRHQIIQTTELVAKKLGLPKDKYSFSFQSRLGSDAWLKPYTVKQLKEFPKAGIKNLVIICPAFVSDCLETLEEIEVEGKEEFMENGGEKYQMVPALNENVEWVDTMEFLIRKLLGSTVMEKAF
jgi:ferrochelatase